jgi:hypothetical protein
MLAFKWLLPIENNRELLNAKITTFEPWEMPIKKGRNELLDSLRFLLRRGWDVVRMVLITNNIVLSNSFPQSV